MEITADYYERFLLLRVAGLVGPLWVKGGQYAISPGPFFLESMGERVSVLSVLRHIDYWFPGRWSEELQRRPAAIYLPNFKRKLA